MPYTETVIVPEVSRVLSSTSAVDVRSEPARSEQSRIAVQARGQDDGSPQIAAPAMFSAAFADHPTATIDMPQGSGVPGCEETNECFVPAAVSVDVGGSVTWTNSDSVLHTVWSGDLRKDVTAVGYDYPNGFQSGLINPGDEFVVEDLKEGTYPYYCSVHPWRQGTLFVTADHGGIVVEPPPRATITEHYSPYEGVCAFDAQGNLYGGKDNYVFKAGISEGVATKWIIPNDLSFVACDDVDSSGRFYFTVDLGDGIMRLNPDSNSFTDYRIDSLTGFEYQRIGSMIADSEDQVYLYWPEHTYVLQGERQAKVFVNHLERYVEYDDDDDVFPCLEKCKDIRDECTETCGSVCTDEQVRRDVCYNVRVQCEETCNDARDLCESACHTGPGKIDNNDKVYNSVWFTGSGVSGPAVVQVLSSDSSVLATSAALARGDGTVYGNIDVPVDITTGTYDPVSDTWDIPPGPYSTTGRNTLVLQDWGQTASVEFELEPDKIITPTPETLEEHPGGTRYYSALISRLDPATNNITTFYSDSGHSGHSLIAIGKSGNLYMESDESVVRFDPESGELLEWYTGHRSNEDDAYGAYADKVYYVERLKYRTMLVELDTEENTLRKWTMPYHRQPSSVAVDEQGDVFLAFGNSWMKFAPSTGTFTEFGYPDADRFEAGRQGAIYWSDHRSGGSIK